MNKALALPVAIATIAAIASCGDPVHSNAVDALGGEANGVRPGPTHRPGQPCLVCHGGSGPAGAEFSVAGTVYLVKGQPDPAPNVTVKITDADGHTKSATTNSVGNFFIRVEEGAPTAPYGVELDYTSGYRNPMGTKVGRDGSCAGCHFGKPAPSTPGAVYLASDPSDLPGAM
jgi:hypothetical protein